MVIYFWGMICGMVFMGVYMATGGDWNAFVSGDTSYVPDWIWFEVFLSPQDGSGAAAMLAFGQTEILGFELDVPWITLGSLAFTQVLWTAIPLLFAHRWFQKRDV